MVVIVGTFSQNLRTLISLRFPLILKQKEPILAPLFASQSGKLGPTSFAGTVFYSQMDISVL